ncbi:MAG TPA: guanylate kinase [Bacillota bacterium]|nr:guanylate kinase [Bacillota bacterium]
MHKHNKGILFVLSGPSGVGKGTVRKRLFEQTSDLKYSISATTRPKRPGEKEGVDYFYKSKEAFEQLIEQNKLLEYAQYVDNYYGTPREYVEKMLNKGYDVFLEIEVQGALQVRKSFSEGVFIFLYPPSFAHLKERITKRGTESEDLVKYRMDKAAKEMTMMNHYDYIVINDHVGRAVNDIQAIIQSEHCRQERLAEHLLKNLEDDKHVRTIN